MAELTGTIYLFTRYFFGLESLYGSLKSRIQKIERESAIGRRSASTVVLRGSAYGGGDNLTLRVEWGFAEQM